MGNFEIEMIAVSDLRPHPRNYRRHRDDQLEHIIESIRSRGFYRNIVVARENIILAGHGVWEAAVKMEIESVPCYRLDLDHEDPRALKVLVGDNEIAQLGEQDDRLLTNILKEIHLSADDVGGLLGTGFDPMMLANLTFITRPSSEVMSFDAAAEWAGMPDYEHTIVYRVIVICDSKEERDAFMQQANLSDFMIEKAGGTTISTHWPPKMDREDLQSLRWVEDEVEDGRR